MFSTPWDPIPRDPVLRTPGPRPRVFHLPNSLRFLLYLYHLQVLKSQLVIKLLADLPNSFLENYNYFIFVFLIQQILGKPPSNVLEPAGRKRLFFGKLTFLLCLLLYHFILDFESAICL